MTDEVEWLMKQLPKETRSKKPKKEKKKSSKVWKVKASDYLPKTPEPTAEEEKLRTYKQIQNELKENKKSKVKREDELSKLTEKERNNYDELIALSKQTAQANLQTAQLQTEKAKLLLENERLVNIEYQQRFLQYAKDMKKKGVSVEVDSDYIRKVLKKNG